MGNRIVLFWEKCYHVPIFYMGKTDDDKQYHLFLYKRRGTQYWYFWYYNDEGKQVKKSCTRYAKTRDDAERFAQLYFHSMTNKNIADHALDLFSPSSTYWEREQAYGRLYKATTRLQYQAVVRNYITPFFGEIKLNEVSSCRQRIEDRLISLKKSARTKNMIISTLNRILADALRRNEIADKVEFDLFSSTSRSKRTALTHEEVQLLFPADPDEAMKLWDDPHGLLYPTMCCIAVSCGLRSGEVRALTHTDISDDYTMLIVDKTIDAKGNISSPKKSTAQNTQSRVVPIPKRTQGYLHAYFKAILRRGPFLFHVGEHPIKKETIVKKLRSACRFAGIPEDRTKNVDVHALRYTYNTVMSSRIPHDLLREWIGHRSEQMTQHYYAPSLADKAEEYKRHQNIVDSFFS